MRITLIQTSLVWEARDQNLGQLEALISPLAQQTDVIVLPEMFTTGFTMQAAKNADLNGLQTLAWMRARAAETGAAVVGSCIVQSGYKYHNRLYWVTPDGQALHYDKRHLFRFAGEDAHYTAGTERLVVEWKGLRICPLICYDLRFPVWSRNTVEYDLAIYVANWPSPRIDAWRTLLKARAIENQCFTVGVNLVGTDGNQMDYSGDSCVFDCAGNTLLHLGRQVGAFTVTLDEAALRAFRVRFDFLGDRDDFIIEL
jgi:omega-amidase